MRRLSDSPKDGYEDRAAAYQDCTNQRISSERFPKNQRSEDGIENESRLKKELVSTKQEVLGSLTA